ncbi:DNA primase [Loktanella sp. 1ANDIMAR09]|nr:DNA primase [Loktanella sp. 1ANDIMAR09]
MSLPPGFLDELRNRLSLGQVVGRKVMWDTRKSNQGKGDLWAPCPFHQEKSASFHVDDRKGFYYCFGCHAKGDAISFVRETENVDFMEAVKILAGEAGMTMPERDPRAQEKADARTVLVDVMEQAVQYHRLQLQTGAAADARDYLARRGLSPEVQARWEIGFAPANGGVLEQLSGKGIDPKLIVDAGLAAQSDRGSGLYNRFRDRIMFPIRDARGRAIGFGGRAMDPNHPAKYYNSPETALFDKGRSLYNHGPAREAAGKGKPLVVAEGYMDVIALSEAGFTATVAPLGTAITEDQLRLMWRMAPEPIIALDGDTAGLRAAMRVIDIALPLLEAGQSLRFALMPEGLDPDDLIKAQGAGAMQKLLDQALTFTDFWLRTELSNWSADNDGDDLRAENAVNERLAKVTNQLTKRHLEREIKAKLNAVFWQARKRRNRINNNRASSSAKRSILTALDTDGEYIREAVILATLIAAPAVAPEFETALEQMDSRDPMHRDLQGCLLRHLGAEDLRLCIVQEMGEMPLEKLFAQNHVAISPAVRRGGDTEIARLCLAEEFAKLAARRGHAREIEDAVEDLGGVADEGLTWRLAQATKAVDQAGRGDNEDKAEYAIGANGARMKKEEKSAFAQLIEQISFAKGRDRPKS